MINRAKRKMLSTLILSGSLAVAGVASTSTAQAGNLYVWMEGTGSNALLTASGHSENVPWNKTDNDTWWFSTGVNHYNNYPEIVGRPASVHGSGTFKVVVWWIPGAGETYSDIPKFVNVRVSQEARVWGSRHSLGNTVFHLSLSLDEPSATGTAPSQTTAMQFSHERKYVKIKRIKFSDAVLQPDGSYKKTFDVLPVAAKTWGNVGSIESQVDPETGDPYSDIVVFGAGANGEATLDPHDLWISTDIDQSYKKVTSPSEFPLKWDSTTQTFIVDKDKFRSTTPADDPNFEGPPTYNGVYSSGPWAIACEPNADGKMTVESVAEWIDPTNSAAAVVLSSPSWYGSMGLATANNSGFWSPSFNWTLFGGTIVNPFVAEGQTYLDALDHQIERDHSQILVKSFETSFFTSGISPQLKSGIHGLDLGGTFQGAGMTSASNLLVTATETNPNVTPATMDAEYNVNWHRPLENFRPDPTVNPYHFSKWNWNLEGSSWVVVDPANKVTVPYEPPNWLWYFAGKSGSLAVAGVSAYAGLALTGPEGIAAALLLDAAGEAINNTTEASQPATQEKDIVYDMWNSAVQDQQVIETDRAASIPNNSTDRYIGVSPAQVSAAFNELNPGDPTQDAVWNAAQIEMTAIVARACETKHFIVDNYDSHGFSEESPGKTEVEKQRYPLYIFRPIGSSAVPTPNPNSSPLQP